MRGDERSRCITRSLGHCMQDREEQWRVACPGPPTCSPFVPSVPIRAGFTSDSYPLSSQPPAPARTCRSFSPALFDLMVHIHPETHRWTWERVSEHAPIWHSTATTRARDATRLPLWDVGRLISPLRQCARDETTNAVIRVASYLGASVWRWCFCFYNVVGSTQI